MRAKKTICVIIIFTLIFVFIPAVIFKVNAANGYYSTIGANMVIKNDNTLWILGDNPVKIMDDVVQISGDYQHKMIIKSDGSLWSWNWSWSFSIINSPVKIMDDVAHCAIGAHPLDNYHYMVIKNDNSLWAWGENRYGQLGDGTIDDRDSKNAVKIMDDVVQVMTGMRYTIAIKKDGSLLAWGQNYYWAAIIGDDSQDYYAYTTTPVKIMNDVVQITAGGGFDKYSTSNHIMVIKNDGSLWGWGNNEYGQLGDGTTDYRSMPVKIMDNINQVSAGYIHTMAVKNDGSLWIWGDNRVGQLGTGEITINSYNDSGNIKDTIKNTNKLTPVKIMNNVVQVASDGSLMAVKKDGSLWVWGIGPEYKPVKIMDNVKTPPLRNGDPLGDVLYSDITAYINGNAIPTSVINGKTLVTVEDLAKYGFDVKWDGKERMLKVELNKSKTFAPIPVTKDTKNKAGKFKCKYLYTDIKTYLSGDVVESYAINGVTLIDFELLKKYGKLTWDGRYRELWLETETKKITYSKKEAYEFY